MDRIAPAAHPVPDLIAARWSPRAFAASAVDNATLQSLLEAARWAASCLNDQPWQFIIARSDAEPEAFAAMLSCFSPNNQAWCGRAPALALSVARTSFAHNGAPNRHAWHDVGQAAANMALAAAALGLQLHQMAGFDPVKARTLFGIPDGFDPVAAIAFGYPGDPAALPEALAKREVAPRNRHPIDSFTHLGAWGATERL
jgi:nitroreductase